MSHTAYLALGTNLGNRMVNLAQALVLLTPFAAIKNWSQVYETPPWGYLDQPPFLNMVVEVETKLEPLSLLDKLKFLEEKIGREKSVRYGPRLIDLDILFYDDIELHVERLDIPHPRIAERAFVLVPLAELIPECVLPSSGQTIARLLEQTDQSGIIPVTQGKNGQPGDIALMFQEEPRGRDMFVNLPPSHQRVYLTHISEAKRSETRRRRFEWTLNQLTGKKD